MGISTIFCLGSTSDDSRTVSSVEPRTIPEARTHDFHLIIQSPPPSQEIVRNAQSFQPISHSLLHRCIVLQDRMFLFFYRSPRFAFTIIKSRRDKGGRRPGAATGRDYRVSVNDAPVHVAVTGWLVQVHHWSIFECYLYTSSTSTSPTRRTGYLILDNELIDFVGCRPPRRPTHRYITDEVEKRWQSIPDEHKLTATALFPEGVMLPLASDIRFTRPKLFAEDYAP